MVKIQFAISRIKRKQADYERMNVQSVFHAFTTAAPVAGGGCVVVCGKRNNRVKVDWEQYRNLILDNYLG